MTGATWLVAGSRPWCRTAFEQRLAGLAGSLGYVESPDELADRVEADGPERVFFLHWSWKVPAEIVERVVCVNFHMTDLPFGRGGSPLQNLIVAGHTETVVTAFVMDDGFDTGPILAKRPLSLAGPARAIYRRAVELSCDLIVELLDTDPDPVPQVGEATSFARRVPSQSRLPEDATPVQLFDRIRMLDADGYPHAFIESGGWRLEFTDAELDGDRVVARVTFTAAP